MTRLSRAREEAPGRRRRPRGAAPGAEQSGAGTAGRSPGPRVASSFPGAPGCCSRAARLHQQPLTLCTKPTRTPPSVSVLLQTYGAQPEVSLMLYFIVLFPPNCVSYEKSGMPRLIFPGWPPGLLGNLRPATLEAAKIIESVKC